MQNQNGQTLIETLVASFILVMGITAALTLATYSLGATNNIRQQTIGLGLAREGIEVVKNMRDTNWLRGTLYTDCHDFLTNDETALCYQDWLNPRSGTGFDLSDGGGRSTQRYALLYSSADPEKPWSLYTTKTSYGLNSGDPAVYGGRYLGVLYYGEEGLTAQNGNSGFARRITIEQDTFPPFDQNTGPRLKVISEVWWESKSCPMTANPPDKESCKVVLETYLTNWRNF